MKYRCFNDVIAAFSAPIILEWVILELAIPECRRGRALHCRRRHPPTSRSWPVHGPVGRGSGPSHAPTPPASIPASRCGTRQVRNGAGAGSAGRGGGSTAEGHPRRTRPAAPRPCPHTPPCSPNWAGPAPAPHLPRTCPEVYHECYSELLNSLCCKLWNSSPWFPASLILHEVEEGMC